MQHVLRLHEQDRRGHGARSSACPGGGAPTSRRTCQAGQHATLIVNGVIGSANVWVNGTQVATSTTVTGAYTRFTFDITSLVRSGHELAGDRGQPERPDDACSPLDNVDWTQIPPDNNTGIQFPVQLQTDGAAGRRQRARQPEPTPPTCQQLGADRQDRRHQHHRHLADRHGHRHDHPAGRGTPITVSQSVTVPANSTQTVSFTPASFPA